MLKDIIEARPLESHQLYLRFEDNIEDLVDLKQLIEFSGIFAPSKDPADFAKVTSGDRPGVNFAPRDITTGI
ncbi:MAG: hypothetical protein ACFB4J_19635 [Elainellaceae cyanobacterium]